MFLKHVSRCVKNIAAKSFSKHSRIDTSAFDVPDFTIQFRPSRWERYLRPQRANSRPVLAIAEKRVRFKMIDMWIWADFKS